MPELPEVETIKLQLQPILKGQVISDVEVLKSRIFQGDKKQIIGKKITNVRRFAKILVIDLEDKTSIAIHLKMSGRLIIQNSELKIKNWEIDYATHKHTRVIFSFKSGDKLYFWDQRMFGWIKIISNIKDQISKMGIEPFTPSFTPENLYAITQKTSRPIKIVLMDQSLVGGIGNIYANDGLFCAKIDPRTKAKSLSKSQIELLHKCLIKVLENGLKYRGASENLFRDAFGQKGELQNYFYVYARSEKPCKICKTAIVKFRLGGRGTFFCPECQKSHKA